MKFFLDTADIAEIDWATRAGLIDGITTNPSLVAKAAAGRDSREVFKEICGIVDGPVSTEVVSLESEGMFEEGVELSKLAENVVVKIPMLGEGLIATRRLVEKGIKVNVTLCFNSMQCLLAAKAGASYVSPFIGRLDDLSHDGMEVIRETRTIFDNYGIETEILTASIRHPRHVVEAALVGSDVATLPTAVLKKLLKHPLTDSGLESFLNDWKKVDQASGAPV